MKGIAEPVRSDAGCSSRWDLPGHRDRSSPDGGRGDRSVLGWLLLWSRAVWRCWRFAARTVRRVQRFPRTRSVCWETAVWTAIPVVLPANGRPGDIAAAQGMLWVTDTVNGRLLRVDPKSRTTAPIQVGQSPLGVARRWRLRVGGKRRRSHRLAGQRGRDGSRRQPDSGWQWRHAGRLWRGFVVGVWNTFDLTLSRIDPDTGKGDQDDTRLVFLRRTWPWGTERSG